MSKYKVIDLWNSFYGQKEETADYTGRIIKRSACSDPNSRFHPTLDHIRPLSDGGKDVVGNIIICHRDTNNEKGNKFPHWEANGIKYIAIRKKGSRAVYDIYEDS